MPQDSETLEAQGKAESTKSKWAQEVLKATAVTAAQQAKEVAETKANREKVVAETAAQRDLNVAKLNREAADQTKQKLILEGEGESTKRKLIMAADGALAIKLGTFERVNAAYAQAWKEYRGNIVPGVVFGGAPSGNGNNAVGLVDLLTTKLAKDLSLDMSLQGQPQR